MLRNNADVRRCSYFDLGLPVVSLQFIPLIEATKKPLTLTEGRLGLTHRRPNFPPTGTRHSPRSASVWRLTTCSNLLQSTGMPIPCIPEWLLMGKTAALHWIVKRGSCRLVLRPPCVTQDIDTAWEYPTCILLINFLNFYNSRVRNADYFSSFFRTWFFSYVIKTSYMVSSP